MSTTSIIAAKRMPPRYPLSLRDTLAINDFLGFLDGCTDRFPDITYFGLLNRYVYVLNHPAMIKYVLQENYQNYHKGRAYQVLKILLGNGLINSEGDFWKRQRRLAQPAFHRERLAGLAQLTADVTRRMLQNWKQREGQVVNFTQEIAQLTIEIVAKALFGAEVNAEVIQKVWESVNFLNEAAVIRIRNPFYPPLWVPTSFNSAAKRHIEVLNNIVYGIIRQRKQNPGTQKHDLLAMLMEAVDEETGEKMSDLQLRDEVMTIFLAGHETTVNAISWTWYLLGQHAAIAEKMRHENNLLFNGAAPQFHQTAQMKYTTNVIQEAMRMYPPVVAIGRTAVADDRIGGYWIAKGTSVIVNIWGMHRHEKYWTNPDEFNPDRFEEFAQKGDNRFVYLPFGGGPRICIGNNFAMLEMQIINSMLAQSVDMELVSLDVKPIAYITLKPEGGIYMRLKKVQL